METHGHPIFTFCVTFQVELLRILVSKGLNVNAVDTRGRSPAHAAAMNNHVTALAVLIGAGRRSPSPPSVPPTSALAGGVRGRDIRLLDLEARDVDGATPLHLAVAAGQLAAVGCLIDAGADVNACDGAGQGCVWRATVDGKVRGRDVVVHVVNSLSMKWSTCNESTPSFVPLRQGLHLSGDDATQKWTIAADCPTLRVCFCVACDLLARHFAAAAVF